MELLADNFIVYKYKRKDNVCYYSNGAVYCTMLSAHEKFVDREISGIATVMHREPIILAKYNVINERFYFIEHVKNGATK